MSEKDEPAEDVPTAETRPHLSLIVSLEHFPNLAQKESQPFSKVFPMLASIVDVQPAKLRLKSWDGTVVHPAKSADEYDLEDDDKVDLFVFVPRTVGHRKKKRKREVEESYENPVTKYFAIKRMNSSLTEGDEALAIRMQEECDREAAQAHQRELELLLGRQAGNSLVMANRVPLQQSASGSSSNGDGRDSDDESDEDEDEDGDGVEEEDDTFRRFQFPATNTNTNTNINTNGPTHTNNWTWPNPVFSPATFQVAGMHTISTETSTNTNSANPTFTRTTHMGSHPTTNTQPHNPFLAAPGGFGFPYPAPQQTQRQVPQYSPQRAANPFHPSQGTANFNLAPQPYPGYRSPADYQLAVGMPNTHISSPNFPPTQTNTLAFPSVPYRAPHYNNYEEDEDDSEDEDW